MTKRLLGAVILGEPMETFHKDIRKSKQEQN
jgi:hypothetical protein